MHQVYNKCFTKFTLIQATGVYTLYTNFNYSFSELVHNRQVLAANRLFDFGIDSVVSSNRCPFGYVDLVHSLAVEPKVDPVLVRLFTEAARKRFFPGMNENVSLEMMGLGVPLVTDVTDIRFFASMYAQMDT